MKPLVEFYIPIRTVKPNNSADGYGLTLHHVRKKIRVEIYRGKRLQGRMVAQFTSNWPSAHKPEIGVIKLTTGSLTVPTIAHECYHAAFWWNDYYGPRNVTPICAEEMTAYALDRMLEEILKRLTKGVFVRRYPQINVRFH